MNTLTVYLRREPTTDPLWHNYAGKRKTPMDIAVYRDSDAKKPFCRFQWHNPKKPRRDTKRVTLNCYRWTAQWLPDANPCTVYP